MLFFFDTETTGLPKNWKAPVTDTNNWPRMVQIAWQVYDLAGNLQSKADYIIKPEGYQIPKDATKIHGISTEQALAEGQNLNDILTELSQILKTSTLLVAHNIDFDEKILGAEFLRKGFDNILSKKQKICTMKAPAVVSHCKLMGQYGYKWPTLQELHKKLFKKNFEDAHNAAIDIEITALCYWQLKKIGVL